MYRTCIHSYSYVLLNTYEITLRYVTIHNKIHVFHTPTEYTLNTTRNIYIIHVFYPTAVNTYKYMTIHRKIHVFWSPRGWEHALPALCGRRRGPQMWVEPCQFGLPHMKRSQELWHLRTCCCYQPHLGQDRFGRSAEGAERGHVKRVALWREWSLLWWRRRVSEPLAKRLKNAARGPKTVNTGRPLGSAKGTRYF